MSLIPKLVTVTSLVTAAVLSSTIPASATAPRQLPQGAFVPAFSHDLPVGHASLAPGRELAPAGLPWTCTVYASNPERSLIEYRYAIDGEGAQYCSGTGYEPTRLKVVVQQYRGLGFWRTKATTDSGYINAWDLSRWAIWFCAYGSGTQTYRIVSTGYAEDGAYSRSVQSERYLRVVCP